MDLLHAAFQHSPDILVIMQVDDKGTTFRYTEANEQFEIATGLQRSQLIGKTPHDLFTPDEARRLLNEYQRCLQTQNTVEFDQVISVPAGERDWNIRVAPLRSHPGYFLISARDITWSRDLVQQLDAISDYLPGFVYQLCYQPPDHWEFTFVGRTVTQMFGISVEDVRNDAGLLLDRIHPDDHDWVLSSSIEAGDSLLPWHAQFRMQHTNGTTLWVEARDLPQRLSDGTITWTGYVNDITARHKLEEEVKHLALHDPLTGLANRWCFLDRLDTALSQTRLRGRSLALFYIDLDHFKPVNDQYGHAVGDELLKQVSRRISHFLRTTDLAGRIGGDEFMVYLLEDTQPEKCMDIATRLCEALQNPFQLGPYQANISASIGIALYPEHGVDVHSLSHAADKAMYQAKNGGRSKAVMAQSTRFNQENQSAA
ncbi:diguanylate cyclase [Pusillimonas sp. DMV24BSW_D]|uniref:sensor domain-containing protein n=1 Tax=Neopusillimonas aestuarii TaxID=2716226 RepID=UPI001409CAFC|nr:diguanylate cyclase [Pusillimonas sp. DMV24BSW_D]QIM49525.1 diguanylate cyclase [Pusillimonas sp. DMV24BSW_D]